MKSKKKALDADLDDEEHFVDDPIPEPPATKKKKKTAAAEDTEVATPTKKKRKSQQEDCEEGAEVAEAAPKEKKQKKEKRILTDDAHESADIVVKDQKAKKEKKTKGDEDLKLANHSETESKREKKKKKGKGEGGAGEDDGDGDTKATTEVDGGNGDAAKSGFCVFVGGIPWAVDEVKLKEDFEECGEVTDVHLLRDKFTGQSRGTAFITFSKESSVKKALKYDGDDYGGRTLKVTEADAKAPKGKGKSDGGGKGGGKAPPKFEVFIKRLAPDTEEATLKADFAKFGTIERLNLPFGMDGRCKGFAWIQFKGEGAMEKALAMDGTDYGGRDITVEKSGQHLSNPTLAPHKGKGRTKDTDKGKGKGASGFEVFIKNFTYETTEEQIRKDFGECGEIARMKMPMMEGKSMGFAWITYKTQEGVDAALAYDGEQYGERRLKVEKAGLHAKGDGKSGKAGK